MAITKAAKKAIRSSEKKRVFNLRRVRTMKQAVKAVTIKSKTEDAKEEYRLAQKSIDKALKGGLLKKNAAARQKAALVRTIKRNSQK